MFAYVVRRFLIAVPVVFGITVLTYLISFLTPGDPVTTMIDPDLAARLGPNWVQQQKAALGLDKPLPVRYVIWVREVARGNLGFSAIDRQPAVKKIGERLWPTLKLMLCAQVISLLISIPIGIIAAVRQYSWIDYLSTLTGLAVVSVPGFFVGLAALYVFGVRFHLLPTAGMRTPGVPTSFGDALKHLILPVAVLGLSEAAVMIRYARSSMLDIIRQDFIVTARAKGLREQAVLLRHALRNALIPLITIVALNFPALIGGTVVIEQIFAWPGMGTLAITSIFGRDYAVIMAINLLAAIAIILSSLLADILYAVADPRVRYA